MGALAVLPSNKCDAHETFHDWSIPPYTATFVVPSVSRAFPVGVSVGVSQAFLRAKSAESQLMWDTERSNCGRPYGLSYQDLRVLYYGSTRHWTAWDIVIVTYPEDQIHATDVTGYFTLAPPTEVVPRVQQYPLWDLDSMKSTAVSTDETSRADSGNTR